MYPQFSHSRYFVSNFVPHVSVKKTSTKIINAKTNVLSRILLWEKCIRGLLRNVISFERCIIDNDGCRGGAWWGVFKMLKGDSTLNKVILGPKYGSEQSRYPDFSNPFFHRLELSDICYGFQIKSHFHWDFYFVLMYLLPRVSPEWITERKFIGTLTS